MADNGVLYEGDTAYGHYIVADTTYSGRPARVLYSGNRQAAQSGVAQDDKPELLFDYNERFMELVRGLNPKRLLLIGGGAFTLPLALQREFPDLHQDIVELDSGLFEITKQYFGFEPSGHVQVHIEDGRAYLEKCTEQYGLILIDVFNHDTVPEAFQSPQLAADLARLLNPDGVVAMNLISAYYGQNAALLLRLVNSFRVAFRTLALFPAGRGLSLWIPQNFILTAQNDNRDLQKYQRYEVLNVPPAGGDEGTHYRLSSAEY